LDKPFEHHIETYVRHPEQLSRQERNWIKHWINKDEELAHLYQWYREFYGQVDAIENEKNKSTDKPAIITVKPFENNVIRKNHYVLAAETTTASKSAYQSFRSFTSDDEQTLLRVLHNRDKQSIRLDIISEHLDKDDIVMIETSDTKKLLISEPGGTLELTESELSRQEITDWQRCNIHLPVLKIFLYKDRKTGAITYSLNQNDPGHVDVDIDEKQISIEFTDTDGDNIPVKMILHTGNLSRYHPVASNICKLPVEDLSGIQSQVAFYH